MKSHIHQIRVPVHTQEWLDWRYHHGIGGSEIASSVAMYSKTIAELTYTPPIKYFLGRAGEPIQEFTGNIASEVGIYFEGVIIRWMKYFDLEEPDQLGMLRRMRDGEKRLNKIISPKVFVTNDKYPNLFYSPDAYMWPKYGTQKFLVETKSTTSMEAARYSNHMSPSFFLQVQQGLMLTELPYAVLAILIDGRFLETITIEPHQETMDLIVKAGNDMWERIMKARAIKKEYELPSYFGVNPSVLTENQRLGANLLADLEPDVIGTNAELEFVRSMIIPKEEDVAMQGTEEQRQWCVEYLELGEEQDALEIERKKRQIYLLQSLEGMNRSEFTDGSFFSYKEAKNKTRRFYISPKVKNNGLS